jgi:ureidoglycolate hydrolase
MALKPSELTSESFKDFGYVLSRESGKPGTDDTDLKYWGKIHKFQIDGDTSTGILYGLKRAPVVVSLERHLLTPEMLIALDGDSVFCFAKPSPIGSDEIGEVQAFNVNQGDAFIMHPGTWHWACFPKDCEAAKFLVVFKSGTEENDLKVKELTDKITVEINLTNF